MNKEKRFFVSTPIYYPNDNLHIGHAYTTVLADIANRYKKNQGYNTYFVTGSDEHGQKIFDRAKEEKISPEEFIKPRIENFKILWNKLSINYDHFIRTTDSKHEIFVQDYFEFLKSQKLIYKDIYSGWYCKYDESFFTKTQIKNEKYCPECGRELIIINEESYFLKITSFKSWIKDLLMNNDFLTPKSRKNELLNNFVKDLKDLSITRKAFNWGIKVPYDENYVIYVWFDALLNYLSTLTYNIKPGWTIKNVWEKDSDTEILQILGKEITRFHAIYWPIILKTKDYKIPKLLAHGWIVDENAKKMSKSIGNVIDPIKLIDKYNKDSIRFYLFNNINLGEDGKFSESLLKETINSILVNKYSNLINRTIVMINKQFNGVIPKKQNFREIEKETKENLNLIKKDYEKNMNEFNFNLASKNIISYVDHLNNYIDLTEPWKFSNKDKELKIILNFLMQEIWNTSILFSPILIDSTEKIAKLFNESIFNFEKWDQDVSNKILNPIPYLFKRLT